MVVSATDSSGRLHAQVIALHKLQVSCLHHSSATSAPSAFSQACRMGIANRDIKLENVLLTSADHRPLLKMCDFGYSINTDHSAPETAVGTPEYTGAPCHDNGYSPQINKGGAASDLSRRHICMSAVLFFPRASLTAQGTQSCHSLHALISKVT